MNYLTASEKYEMCDMLDPENHLAIERDLAREVLGVGEEDA